MKNMYVGVFNLNRQIFTEYTYASSERQAWFIMCRRIAEKTDVHPRVTMGTFDGSRDNYKIRKELEFEEAT